jgi:putative endonuclease
MVSSIASAKEDFLVTNSELRMAGHPEKIRMMYYTYVIESIRHPENRYIGHTSDLKQRVAEHNAGRCDHTAKFVPWKLKIYIAFETLEQAQHFERYLKSGSGHAFADRHFWQPEPD